VVLIFIYLIYLFFTMGDTKVVTEKIEVEKEEVVQIA